MNAACSHLAALLLFFCFAPLSTQPGAVEPPARLAPTELPGLNYTNQFFPGARYRAEVPTQVSLLGFDHGSRATTAAEIEKCLRAWTAAAPDRCRLVEYARSYEGRALHYVVVTAPANLQRLDELQRDLARLADPRETDPADAEAIIARSPAVAWLAYTIHGDETEGSDAALAVLYHLIACEDPAVAKLLEDLVIIVDPLMNPDGRDRFVKMIAENRGAVPNVDDQSLIHDGYWPFGRGNHYLFDLNRDWLWLAHPETRGRVRELARWNPVLFVDAHGMGSQDTHLFSPPREPVNPHFPAERKEWGERFARDQARAFDDRGLVYYSGEWHEEWYPGYSDAYASYRGAVGILYEQARVAEDGVRRPEGRILSYRESVQHHVIGSLANLRTTQTHARDLLRRLWRTRQAACDPADPYGRRTFAVPPSANGGRLSDFAELLRQHGIELLRAKAEITVPRATDQLGRELSNVTLPAGTLLIPNGQPLGHLVAAMLDFDPRLSPEALQDERRELLQNGRTRIYDTTAWNVTMMFGLPALTLPERLTENIEPWTPPDAPPPPAAPPAPVAFALDGADDRSVAVAARLLERGVRVRVSDRPFRFDGRDFARGSVVVTALDNRTFAGDLPGVVQTTATELRCGAVPVTSGLGPGDLPDLGGRHFRLLEPPRIGLLSRGALSSTDYGSIWYALDHRLAIRHSHLDESATHDLRRYNVLIVPERWGAAAAAWEGALKDWVRAGGTLIAIGNSALGLMAEKAEFSRVRQLPDALPRLAEYELTVLREWLGRSAALPAPEAIWDHQARPGLKFPWQAVDGPHPEEKELKKRDAWLSLFMPQGALLAARVDTNSWLTFGCEEWLPVMAGRGPILMAADGVEAPVRLGYLVEAPRTNSVAKADSDGDKPAASDAATGPKTAEKKEPPRVGWSALPPGTEMHLRMSGLLWPEAAHRLANSAHLTREAFGRGQIILFASSPTFRAATRGQERLFLNAVVYGPGLGASAPIQP
jgi:hypothetical protein